MQNAKIKIKPHADRQMMDVKHKIASLILMKHLHELNKPKRKGGMTKVMTEDIPPEMLGEK